MTSSIHDATCYFSPPPPPPPPTKAMLQKLRNETAQTPPKPYFPTLPITSAYYLKTSPPPQGPLRVHSLSHLYNDSKNLAVDPPSPSAQPASQLSDATNAAPPRKKKHRVRDDVVLSPMRPLDFPYHNDSTFLAVAEQEPLDHLSVSSGTTRSSQSDESIVRFVRSWNGPRFKPYGNALVVGPRRFLKRKYVDKAKRTCETTVLEEPEEEDHDNDQDHDYNDDDQDDPAGKENNKPNLISKVWRMLSVRRRQNDLKRKSGETHTI